MGPQWQYIFNTQYYITPVYNNIIQIYILYTTLQNHVCSQYYMSSTLGYVNSLFSIIFALSRLLAVTLVTDSLFCSERTNPRATDLQRHVRHGRQTESVDVFL